MRCFNLFMHKLGALSQQWSLLGHPHKSVYATFFMINFDISHRKCIYTGWPIKNDSGIQTPISHELFKLLKWKSNQIELHSISFLLMYTIMSMRPIEMVKIAFWKKSPQQKSCQIHLILQFAKKVWIFNPPFLTNPWHWNNEKGAKLKLIQFFFEWCMVIWSSKP